MEDVGCRVVKLRLRERARRPVVLLPRGREPGAKVALEADVETERGSAQEARPDRGVEERGEPEAVATLAARGIVAAGMEHARRPGPGEDPAEPRQASSAARM